MVILPLRNTETNKNNDGGDGDNVTTIIVSHSRLSIVIHPFYSIHPGQGIHSNTDDAGGKAKAAASLRHDLYEYGASLRSTLWECAYPIPW